MTGPISLSVAFYRFNKVYKAFADVVVGMTFDPAKDIVLVTGGAAGLGKEIVTKFANKGAKQVVVLDINVPPGEEQIPDVIYFQCDVSNAEQVIRVSEHIKSEIGTVTLLINNAGITKGKRLSDLSFNDIEKTIQVNLLSSFYTIKAFLPGMTQINRGYIVTIASVLGYISPARLSVYGASKSGLIALHESLTYELGSPSFSTQGVKTLLICPGQIKTPMFLGVKTPSSFFAPELDPSYVAEIILKSVLMGRRGEKKVPFYANFIPIVRAFPWPIQEIVRGFSGMDNSMRRFVGNWSEVVSVKATSKISSKANSIRSSA